MDFFATCPAGFEQLLASELRALHLDAVRPLTGQVAFAGSLVDAYRTCLWSRLASRVIAVLGRVDATDSDALYAGLSQIAWEEHLAPGTKLAIDAHGTNAQLRTTQFVSLRSKDAITDRMHARTGTRVMTDPAHPDLTVAVRIQRNRATVGIDLAGEPLFRRGYEASRASTRNLPPLRCDYAAALLAAGMWGTLCAKGPATLLVPFSGSGTLAVEAYGMACGHAPGLLRTRWGFMGWQQHDDAIWQEVLADARSRAAVPPRTDIQLVLSDQRPGYEAAVRQALRAAGLDVQPQMLPADELSSPTKEPLLAVCDLSWIDPAAVATKASALARLGALAEQFGDDAHAVVLAADAVSDAVLGAPEQTLACYVGRDEASMRLHPHPQHGPGAQVTLGSGERISMLVPASEQFARRLTKVARQRRKWARREDISCYRVYDADLPDYAVSLDLYAGAKGSWLQIYEYAPPKGIDPTLAQQRLLDVMALAPAILDVKPSDTFVRTRLRARGGSQYADEAVTPKPVRPGRGRAGMPPLPPGAHLVDEGGLTFEVNFSTRLDCGIFLDHRETRAMLREMAKQTKGSKRFLNLFAYTGTGTCYAADGGMRHTTTVDLSRPSLDWAQRNMARNGFTGPEHEFIQADVIRWVSEQRRTKNRWDLVFCDVPTFSNSRRMRSSSFDVQRDHAELLIGVSRLLTRDGTCVFSCNLRTFKLDEAALAKAGVVAEDITAQTIPEDFARNPRIHKCYLLRRTPRGESPTA